MDFCPGASTYCHHAVWGPEGRQLPRYLTPGWERHGAASDGHLEQHGGRCAGRKTANKLLSDANGIAKDMGLLQKFQYINYADPGQDPIGSYGAANVRRLKAVSWKYDAKGIFQKQVPGGFKLL